MLLDFKTPVIVYSTEKVASYFTSKRDVYEPEEGETIFVLVRHGENESNVARTCDGRTLNLPLTPKGLNQGEIAGRKIRNKVTHIDHVITTPMCRTLQTAEKILEAFSFDHPEFTEDSRLLERYVGKYEGRLLSEQNAANKKDKEVSASTELSFEYKMQFCSEEGEMETFAAIWERAHPCLQQTSSELNKKVVLAVTHSGTIRCIYWHLTQQLGFFVPYANFKPLNGAFMVVSVKSGKMSLLETEGIQILSQ